MNKRTINLIGIIAILALFIMLTGCGEEKNKPKKQPEQSQPELKEDTMQQRSHGADEYGSAQEGKTGQGQLQMENQSSTGSAGEKVVDEVDFDAAEVIKKHLLAKGQKALLKKKTRKQTGTFNQRGARGDFTMIVKRSNKYFFRIEFDGKKTTQAYNGEVAWRFAPYTDVEPKIVRGKQYEFMKEKANMDGLLYNWKEEGLMVEPMGVVEIENRKAYKIKLSKIDRDYDFYYIDTQKYLVIKIEHHKYIGEKEISASMYLGDYRNVEGVMVAHKIINLSKGQPISEINVEKTVFNEEIRDVIFELPPS